MRTTLKLLTAALSLSLWLSYENWCVSTRICSVAFCLFTESAGHVVLHLLLDEAYSVLDFGMIMESQKQPEAFKTTLVSKSNMPRNLISTTEHY